MTKHRLISTTFACVLLLTASSATAGVELLAPRLSISEEYTDNLYLSDADKQEEFTTIISPGLDYSSTLRDGGIEVSYTAGYVIYQKTEEDEVWRHDASVYIWSDLTKHTRAEFRNLLVRSDESRYRGLASDIDGTSPLPEDTTRRTGRNEYLTNGATASLTHQFGEQNVFTLSALMSLRKEYDPEYNNDNKRYAPTASLSYWLTPQLGLDISGTYTRGIFEASSDFDDWQGLATLHRVLGRRFELFATGEYTLRRYDEATSTNYDLYSASAGLNYNIEDSISLTLGGGYYLQDMMDEAPDNDGYFFNADIDKTWTFPRGTATLTGSAGLDRNEFGTENLGLERYYSVSISSGYMMARHIETGINAAFYISEYLNTPDNRTDKRGQAGCYLSFSPRTWFSINASYSHNLLRSNFEGDEYDENVALMTVSFSPQGRRYVDGSDRGNRQ